MTSFEPKRYYNFHRTTKKIIDHTIHIPFHIILPLTSSLRTPKFFVKEFSYFLMPCHQHGLRINLLVQR